MTSITAELLRPPAPALPAMHAAAITEALAAFRRLARAEDLRAATVDLLGPLSDLQVVLAHDGHDVQAGHVADAMIALVGHEVPRQGEYDEETLERERWRRIDEAVDHLQAALSAHVWRAVMTIDVRVANAPRVREAA